MTKEDIAQLRLYNQGIARSTFKKPEDVVRWLGAVQAQDYLGALWAVGLRMHQATENLIEKSLTNKSIVRTWPMRGTLHFVPAEDVRWMLKLLTPRIIAKCATLYKQSELDDATFKKSKKLFSKALEGGKKLERKEMYDILEKGGISTSGQRGLHILGNLALNGLICFGDRAGKQQTFTLLDEWIPASGSLTKEESLAKLSLQYFKSHGPATLQDFAWWTGLAPADAKTSLELIKSSMVSQVIEDRTYWMTDRIANLNAKSSDSYLLPAYDEYTVAYKDRSAVLDSAHAASAGNGIFNASIVSNGKLVGTWKRTIEKNHVAIKTSFFPKSKINLKGEAVIEKYSRFMKMPVKM